MLWHWEEEPHNNLRHQEDKLSMATSSLFPSKIIAKLEWSNTKQTIEDLHNTTMGETIKSESATTEPPP